MSFGAQEALERFLLLVGGYLLGLGTVGLLVWFN
jgi:hypothetical protein